MHEDVRKFRNAGDKLEAEYAMAQDGRAEKAMIDAKAIIPECAYGVEVPDDHPESGNSSPVAETVAPKRKRAKK